MGPNIGFAAQSASTQQLPAAHTPLQQKSVVLAAQGPLALHMPLTHWPVLVLQIVVEP
jgi:hypothetical protein